ncbi:CBS domain-containing protein [Winogradskyella helgolandensis]|uniref:CBS domain-containing protein n=1 Tax=Winogradskyella helgolandensis TaxID=2697010 RepID=UPI0015C1A2AC|nr:CBS domain-containing protein [Winogradskyella helgolandensis]
MGFQLWYSKQTGIKRKGTSFSELQNIFTDNITTKFIFEPLACCKTGDNTDEVIQTLKQRNFDTLGVVNQDDIKIGYIKLQDLGDNPIDTYIQNFDLNILIAESTPLSELIKILCDKEFVYVLSSDSIQGIVTRADINKPIVRIYLFGIISLFELHLNYWITDYHIEESWTKLLKDRRIESARGIYDDRKGNNAQLTLLECIQISDKKVILRNTDNFLAKFDYSKKGFHQLLERSEKIRNELAHSQTSIIANLPWADFASTIQNIELFLKISEAKVTEK